MPAAVNKLSELSNVEFAGYHLYPKRRLLTKVDGSSIPLHSRAFDTLVALVAHQGETVAKQDLLDWVWPNAVVEENNLNQAIFALRKALSEGQDKQQFIVTIPGRGYCFVAQTQVIADSPLVSQAAAAELSDTTGSAYEEGNTRTFRVQYPRYVLLACVAVLTLLVAMLARFWERMSQQPSTAALTEITRLLEQDQYGAAFARAYPLKQDRQLRSPELEALWSQIVLPIHFLVEQDGARVWFKPYGEPDEEWIDAGLTPMSNAVSAPRGALRVKVEKQGFATAYFAIANPGPSVQSDGVSAFVSPAFKLQQNQLIPLPLVPEGNLPEGMVQVPRTDVSVNLGGWTRSALGDYRQEIPAFAIGQREVTNAEFKQFVDAGGYDNATYWQGLDFHENGQALGWEAAHAKFVDTTNRPGPAGWQLSTYPTDEADLPVGGISWYEAMAYARFRGQMLPTVHHWTRAAFSPLDALFSTTPVMTITGRFTAPEPITADSSNNLGPWGTVNMTGNMREWVWNFAGEQALALGGAWQDYAAEALMAHPVPPMWRLPEFGLRLMQTPATPLDAGLLEPIELVKGDGDPLREPVSDDAFAAMRFQFTALHEPPVTQTSEVLQETPLWVAEQIDLTYANAKTSTLVIVRPKQHSATLQPILYGPTSACCFMKRANREVAEHLAVVEFVVNSGRALILPIWDGSYERFEAFGFYQEPEALRDKQRRTALGYQQDASRVIDYLATRADMDVNRIGYLGFSFGSSIIGPVVLALEERIKAAVWISGGIAANDSPHPMLDAVNYAPRIHQPVLMLNGRFDHLFPFVESQQRLFDLLGTAVDRKAHHVNDAGHIGFPPNIVARETSNWYDQYLGVVDQKSPSN